MKNRKVKLYKLILFFIGLLIIIRITISLITAVLRDEVILFKDNKLISMKENVSFGKVLSYNFSDLIKTSQSTNINISIESINSVVYENKCIINVNIDNFNDKNSYEIVCGTDRNKMINYMCDGSNEMIECKLIEGENVIYVDTYLNGNLIDTIEKKIYFIEPYNKQFMDELSENSITVHYRAGTYEDRNKSMRLLNNLGVNYIRTDFFWGYIYKYGKYDFSKYDIWIKQLEESNPNMKMLGILNITSNLVGSDRKIDSEEEVKGFVDFATNVANHYSEITNFEILNEPNGIYVTEEDLYWYNRVILETTNALKEINPKIEIVQYALSAGEKDTDSYLSSKTFFEKTFNKETYLLSDAFSYNVYYYLDRKLQTHSEQFNRFGGFIKNYITEYGSSMYNKDEIAQVNDLITQSCLLNKYNIEYRNIYNLWNTANNSTAKTNNFGLLYNDYTPKPSYYAMKNYYENTNGSEYVGDVDLIDSKLKLYVYDKDGNPLAICWAADSSETIIIGYSGFVAYDVYGNLIPNENGQLTISSTPVYLKGIDRKYFYEAISNNAVANYDNFLSDYEEYLNLSDEMIDIKNKVVEMNEYAKSLATGNEISEDEAIRKMEEHFDIGNSIINAYVTGNLICEDVNVSSMLDSLNTISYAFEDLVTITANDVSNVNLELTKKKIDVFNQKIARNPDADIVYPKKINSFAEDYYEISTYINGLKEENPIKNGLIVSKGLHSLYLTVWANSFANNYLKESMITVEYSTTELTNSDVIATLVSKVPIEMESSNVYTFTENGSFTFKYLLDGVKKEVTITVDWIDKEAPIITGWEDRVDELEVATIDVSDDNLDIIVVTKDGEKIDFNNGDTLFDVGTYEIVATDKVGNSSTIVLRIVDYIESNKTYYISNNGNGDGLSENSPMSIGEASKIRYYAGDKILFKSGEKYKIDLNWSLMGSPTNKITISSFGVGFRPIIEGSITLVSNLNISNIYFTNNNESCLVTNQNYCENVDIDNCIFNSVNDIAIYLNRQVYNFDIKNCIFRDCFNAAIAIKNDAQKLIADNIKIYDNIFVCSKANIIISGKNSEEIFSEVEIYDNAFLNQTDENAAIFEFGAVRDTEFDVSLYNNVYYNFARVYMVGQNDVENLKNNLRSDNNTFYSIDSSKFINDCNDFDVLKSEYKLDSNSSNILMSGFAYQIDLVSEIANESLDKNEIMAYMTQTILKADSNQKVITVDTNNSVVLATTGFDQIRTSMIGSASELADKNSQEEIIDVTVAEQEIPLTGWKKFAIIVCTIVLVMGAFSGRKYIKYLRDIKKQIKK